MLLKGKNTPATSTGKGLESKTTPAVCCLTLCCCWEVRVAKDLMFDRIYFAKAQIWPSFEVPPRVQVYLSRFLSKIEFKLDSRSVASPEKN